MLRPADGHAIVDTGPSTGGPLLYYVATNDIPDVVPQTGYELVVHTVVIGGQALLAY
jgi:hypothetical protein